MDVGKKIAIVGAGFSGTAVAAMLSRITAQPIEITLFDKTGIFGAGDAYRTPYPWHILNVRARDMSVFEDQPTHFVDWVSARQSQYPEVSSQQVIAEQFLPRYIYHHYLRDLLQQLRSNKNVTLHLVSSEVIGAEHQADKIKLTTHEQQHCYADKVVLALGNYLPMEFPFPVSGVNTIANPWDYSALKHIPADADVMMVGMGLTMIDAVLTLQQQQHRGKIYAISRHGLLPQPHADIHVPYQTYEEYTPIALRALIRQWRKNSLSHMQEGGDWRSIINVLRAHIPTIWQHASVQDKKRFMRHLLPYWNVHRHRVHQTLMDMLQQLIEKQQLQIMAGRVVSVAENQANIRLRKASHMQTMKVDWLINCMGPGLSAQEKTSSLLQSLTQSGNVSLDPLAIGLSATQDGRIYDATGQLSSSFFTLGPPAKGAIWECTAVPEIRRQSYALAKNIIGG